MIRSARVLCDAQAAANVLVEVESVSACRRCAQGQGCGAGIFNHGIQASRIECFTSASVSANQVVDIEIEEAGSVWLWLVAGAYGLPLLGLLLASLVANWVLANNNDAAVAIAALIGLAGGVIAWRLLSTSVFARLEPALCLNSARIVNIRCASVTPILESSDEN